MLTITNSAAPSWTVRPADARVADGGEAVVKCEASGDPKPEIVWKRLTGMTTCSSDFHSMNPNSIGRRYMDNNSNSVIE